MTPRNPSPEVSSEPTPTPETGDLDSPSLSPLFVTTPIPPMTDPLDMSSQQHPWSQSPDESPSPDGDSDSSRPSTGSRRTAAAKRRELREMAAAAVETVGGAAHQLLTAEGSPEREQLLYVPDSKDVQAISDPLAGLASRRMPEGAENPDLADLVRLALGVVAYVVKQRAKRARIAQMFGFAQAEPDPVADVPADQPA